MIIKSDKPIAACAWQVVEAIATEAFDPCHLIIDRDYAHFDIMDIMVERVSQMSGTFEAIPAVAFAPASIMCSVRFDHVGIGTMVSFTVRNNDVNAHVFCAKLTS